MGEEQKEEGKKEEGEKKEEEEEEAEIVLKVDMHCAGCARKVERSLKGFEGVDEVKTDSKAKKVIVKGKAADPVKLCDRIQKKTGRKVELISPLPKPPEEEKKEDPKEPPKEEEKKEEPPKPITVILKVRMHCEACAQVLQKRIKKMEGVESVVTDVANDQVIVKGFVDPVNLVNNVYRRTRKQASIVQDEEKKEEEKKAEEEQKKKEEKGEEEKKEKEDDDGKKSEAKKFEYLPYYHNKYYMDYTYPPPPPTPPPQMFSDENPNACSVM